MDSNYELEFQPFIHCIRINHPELANEQFQLVDSSWSNYVIIVGNRYIFRFPKTKQAWKELQLEKRILPKLGDKLTISIPSFNFISGPNMAIAYVCYPLIQGSNLSQNILHSLTIEQKVQLQQDLGAFLSELHSFPLKNIYKSNITAVQVKKNWEHFYKRIQRDVSPLVNSKLNTAIQLLFKNFLSNPSYFNFTPCLLHADLKPEHLLFDLEKNRLSGVIDFGAMEVGDPAFEFVGLYRAYGEEFIREVLDSYKGIIDITFWERITRFYLKIMSFYGVLYGIETRNEEILQKYLSKLQNSLLN